jgi:hypothetical protein
MGRFVIAMPAVSYARELWRFGEADLAERAAEMTATECAIVGERAGEMYRRGVHEQVWPDGPRAASVVMLAVIEHLEGRARPCARKRRLPERSLPDRWRLTEEERWQEARTMSPALDAHLRRPE